MRAVAGGRWIAAAMTCVAVAVASAVYQDRAERRDRREYPPPGRLVPAGGTLIHVLEAGPYTAPAVVVIPELSGNVLAWITVQEKLATDTHVVVYDRAGCGFSGPLPSGRRTFSTMAAELHEALAAAGVAPPYVLVGHSFGGIIARRYAIMYPEDIAGMVLVESSHEHQATRMIREGPLTWGVVSTARAAVRLRLRVLGARRLATAVGLGTVDAGLASSYEPRFADAARMIASSSRTRRATVRELMLLTRNQKLPPPDLGDMPLTVLTAADRNSTWLQLQGELAQLSSTGRHVVAETGGHRLQHDNPDTVVTEIRALQNRLRVRQEVPRRKGE